MDENRPHLETIKSEIYEGMPPNPTPTNEESHSKRNVLIGSVLVSAVFYAFCGFYSVQPIGALPDGATVIVWRHKGEPFFNSADAMCLERMGGVSLMCRAMAMGQGPSDRIIVRLPYVAWVYSLSTGGREFDR